MNRHVTFLAILSTIWGVIGLLVGASALLLAVGPAVILGETQAESISLAAGFIAALFAVTGLFALLWGAGHVWVARLLRRRQPLGRLLALAQALVNLLILPFGTALGIYALWVLLANEGRRLFEYNQEATGT